MTCTQCNLAMHRVEAIDEEGEFQDVFDEDGHRIGETIKIKTSTHREFWQCPKCGAEWPA